MMDIEEIKNRVEAQLGEKRFDHTIEVANEAVKLAEKWGESTEKAYLAGLIHDYAKEISKDRAAEMLRAFGVSPDYMLENCPALLHGPLAACLAKAEFGIEDQDVLNAVWYHTGGRYNMSCLEKIIYLADFIEPNRCFEGVEEVRRLAYENLDRAVLREAEMIIEFMIDRNQFLHIDTVKMRNELLFKVKEETEHEG